MNRRQAIGLGIGAAIAIPAGLMWWNKSKLEGTSILNENRKAILAAAVDAIIPEGKTPGAKLLGVDFFVAKIVEDCLDTEKQALFGEGLVELDKAAKKQFSKAFKLLSAAEQLEVLKAFSKEDGFIDLLRNLTIRGYNTSEYVMSNIQHFEFIPGQYLGCVDLKLNTNG